VFEKDGKTTVVIFVVPDKALSQGDILEYTQKELK
jgi:hypothetical protein